MTAQLDGAGHDPNLSKLALTPWEGSIEEPSAIG